MKCVLTAAGLGTRLLPLTKELPKEMLPIYAKSIKGSLIMKPILQVIFESLYGYNIRNFCFVTGRTKRAIRDHFKPDFELIRLLKKNKKCCKKGRFLFRKRVYPLWSFNMYDFQK